MRDLSPLQWKRLTWSYEFDPPADWHLLRSLAMLVAATYNVSMNRGENSPFYEAEDFLPDWDGTRGERTPAAGGDYSIVLLFGDDEPEEEITEAEQSRRYIAAVMAMAAAQAGNAAPGTP